jgi:hypothetical protein
VHSLVRRYIKTAIAFLFVGLALGAWMIVRRELLQHFPTPYAVSAHTHAIFVGFVMMMILGVALWLFPRPDKTDTRYSPALAEAAYWLLVTGTTARIAGELARPASAPRDDRHRGAVAGRRPRGLFLHHVVAHPRARIAGTRVARRAILTAAPHCARGAIGSGAARRTDSTGGGASTVSHT